MAKIIRQPLILTDYDKESDVLYISFGKPRKAIGIEIEAGDIIRIDPFNDKIVGITLIDFDVRYGNRPGRTIKEKAKGIMTEILEKFKEYCKTKHPPINACLS
jgi:uncharacterized protein YuzE